MVSFSTKFVVPFVIAAIPVAGALWVNNRHEAVQAQTQQSTTIQTLDSRVTAIEQHQKDEDQNISHLVSQVDKLVEWALGHK